jgi:hypothetical protein
MRKISSYLYPNRIQLLADVAGFTTEYTNVYQRNVKIYQGVDNVLEFDIKNADQKRLELNTSPTITQLELNVMDAAGNALPNSPYTITPNPDIKGIATVVIPGEDVAALSQQFLRYSVTALKGTNTIPLYADSRFGAVGTIELVGSAMPITREEQVYTDFPGEIDYSGTVLHHSSAIPAKFYEAVPTTSLTFDVAISSGFLGKVYIEGTKDMTISVNSFTHAAQTTIFDNIASGVKTPSATTVSITMSVSEYNYFRITWQWPPLTSIYSGMDIYGGYGADNGPGKVEKITVYSGDIPC